MIESAKENSLVDLPLIRLRLQYTDSDQMFELKRFGREFDNKVANKNEIIRFVKKRDDYNSRNVDEDAQNDDYQFNLEEMMHILDDDKLSKRIQVGNIMDEYFDKVSEEYKLG